MSTGSQSTFYRQQAHSYAVSSVQRCDTSNQILIQTVHLLHIRFVNIEPTDVRILLYSSLVHTLRQRNIAMLETPPHHELPRCAAIFLCQLDDDRVLHSQRSGKWGVGFDGDVVLLAVGSKLRSSVERMHFYLIDSRFEFRFRGEELVDLWM